jgi:hypothetical protein
MDVKDFVEVRTIQEARLGNSALLREIDRRFGKTISAKTVGRMRTKLHFDYRRPSHVQSLTESHKIDGLVFREAMLEWDDEMLESIYSSDESRVVLGTDNHWVSYRKGEDNPSANVETLRSPGGLVVFGVIGLGYKSRLLVVDGTINTDRYIANCQDLGFIDELDSLRGPLRWIYQQDGASCHVSSKALDWLEESCDVLQSWPAHSPDLSPIELCWAILKQGVSVLNPKTLDQLRDVLTKVWTAIPLNSIDQLLRSFRSRLIICRDREGESISDDLWMISDRACLAEFENQHWRPRREWSSVEDERIVELHLLIGANGDAIGRSHEVRTQESMAFVAQKAGERKIDDRKRQLAMRIAAREHYPWLRAGRMGF